MNQNQDEAHLQLLSIFHYVVGGMAALVACFPFIHVIIGIAMLTGLLDDSAKGEEAPAFLGWIFIGVGTFVILAGWTLAICLIAAGRSLAKRRRYVFCTVVAGISCLFMPFGTVLGIFTLLVLTRPSVKALFTAETP
jgi:hypothetical protein